MKLAYFDCFSGISGDMTLGALLDAGCDIQQRRGELRGLQVPAQATANLLQGQPTYSNGVQRELVTPTGAAIVATLCDSFGPQPAMNVSAIGYGAGTADLEGQPNVLRIMIGEAAEKVVPGFDEEISVIEANLDDMNPQIYGYFQEKPLAAGALDVYTTPVQMKKNRPGTLLTLLCKPQDANALM